MPEMVSVVQLLLFSFSPTVVKDIIQHIIHFSGMETFTLAQMSWGIRVGRKKRKMNLFEHQMEFDSAKVGRKIRVRLLQIFD